MKPLFLFVLLFAGLASGAEWDVVRRIPAGEKVEVSASDGSRPKGVFVSASDDALVLRETAGERSLERSRITLVRVYHAGRRTRMGLLGVAIGAGAGAGVGFAICPGCRGEGVGGKYIGPGVAIGAAIGALGFLASPYRTVYRAR